MFEINLLKFLDLRHENPPLVAFGRTILQDPPRPSQLNCSRTLHSILYPTLKFPFQIQAHDEFALFGSSSCHLRGTHLRGAHLRESYLRGVGRWARTLAKRL